MLMKTFQFQKHSITIPMGRLKFTRKVEELTIIIRSYTSTKVDKK